MKAHEERLLAMLVVFCFAFTLINVLVAQGVSLTEEEAIEISRNSKLVQSLLESADYHALEVHYLNSTQVNENHGRWLITWYIHPIGAVSAFSYVVSHSIDEETGEILDEGWLSLR